MTDDDKARTDMYWMGRRDAAEEVRVFIAELRQKYQPIEGAGSSQGQLGFDYGYQQGLIELNARLYRLVTPRG